MIEYISQHVWQLWTVIAVICLILELMAGDFFIICFSIGALFAALAAAFGLGVWIQLAAFALFTLVCLFWLRPFAKRYLRKGEDQRVSNADALLGRQGRVVETVKAGGYGRVAIDGDDWKAQGVDGAAIDKDVRVRVVKMNSIILTVEPVTAE